MSIPFKVEYFVKVQLKRHHIGDLYFCIYYYSYSVFKIVYTITLEAFTFSDLLTQISSCWFPSLSLFCLNLAVTVSSLLKHIFTQRYSNLPLSCASEQIYITNVRPVHISVCLANFPADWNISTLRRPQLQTGASTPCK